ncbi:TPA: hypothetical protein ACP43J_005548, partial [Escherichia coli]
MRQENACKAMHLIYAWLFSVKTGGFSGNFTQTDVMPVAHFYAKKSCSAQGVRIFMKGDHSITS